MPEMAATHGVVEHATEVALAADAAGGVEAGVQAGDGVGVGVEHLEAAVHAQARHDLADLAGAGDAVERRLGHGHQPVREILRGEV